MAHITDLPVEVLLLFLQRLSCCDICSLARSSKFFRGICYLDDTWQYFCRRDYGVNSLDKWGADSYMDLFKTVLFKFGNLIGRWWKANIHPYGGLLSVEAEPGRLVCYLCHAPRNNCIIDPFVKQELFELRIEDGKCVKNCLSGKSVHRVEKLLYLNDQPPRFSFQCLQSSYHPECELNSVEYEQWYKEQNPNFDPGFFFPKYRAYNELWNIECEMLQWSDDVRSESLPKPGLYKGTYGGHGVEIIMVHYDSTCNEIIGTKITGDHNIPATKITFKVNTDKVVTHKEINELHSFHLEQNHNEVALTEFRLPYGYDAEYGDFPNKVKARYHCVGQVAYDGYSNPSWSCGHLILFSANCFGVLWIELCSLGVYSRVGNQFNLS